jgi:alpha-L-rhamnosidase
MRGQIEVEWEKREGSLTLRAVVPANTRATVSVPTAGIENAKVTEGGTPAWSNGAFAEGANGITAGRQDGDYITFDVGSGRYEFEVSTG